MCVCVEWCVAAHDAACLRVLVWKCLVWAQSVPVGVGGCVVNICKEFVTQVQQLHTTWKFFISQKGAHSGEWPDYSGKMEGPSVQQ